MDPAVLATLVAIRTMQRPHKLPATRVWVAGGGLLLCWLALVG